MMIVGRLSPRPCLLLLFSFYLVSYRSISSAFRVIPHQQAMLTSCSSNIKQGFGYAVTLLPTNVNVNVNVNNQATRSAVNPPPCCALRLFSSFRNQDDKDDVSTNVFASTSTTSNNDIRKEEYQAQVEEMQRQRRDCGIANKSSTKTDLVRLGIVCCLLLLVIALILKGGTPY